MPKFFHILAFEWVAYVRNRTPDKLGYSPYEKFFGHNPPSIKLIPFGCRVFAVKPVGNREKGGERTDKCIMLGYSAGSKDSYRLLNQNTNRIVVRRDIKAIENYFPFISEISKVDKNKLIDDIEDGEMSEKNTPTLMLEDDPEEDELETKLEAEIDQDSLSDPDYDSYEEESVSDEDVDHSMIYDPDIPSLYEKENNEEKIEQSSFAQPQLYSLNVEEEKLPTCLRKAIEENKWYDAVKKEISSHIKNRTFKLVSHNGEKLIGSKFVFAIKYDENGKIAKYKARFVALGCHQIEGIHYTDTFAPTLNPTCFRLLIALTIQTKNTLHQLDVETAFLIPLLPKDEVVFMRPPPGFEQVCSDLNIKYKKGEVLRLQKCIYGLKQASHYWNNDLTEKLKNLNFSPTSHDPCFFVKKQPFMLLAVHVDDILVWGKPQDVVMTVEKLCETFPMKNLGFPKIWTGIEIVKNEHEIKLQQKLYLETVLSRFGMSDCKPNKTPTPSQRLTEEGSESFEDITLYQSAVGSLMWPAIMCRPDILYAVIQVARFASKPKIHHWKAVKTIMRYIQGSLELGIVYKQSDNFILHGISDSDWAGCETRQSHGGYFFYVGDCLLSWKSKLNKSICLSSMESETVFLSLASQEAIWLKRLVEGIYLPNLLDTDKKIEIQSDSQSAIMGANNNKIGTRTKHIHIRDMFVRKAVNDGNIKLKYCPSSELAADILTKPLGSVLFKKLRDLMGMK